MTVYYTSSVLLLIPLCVSHKVFIEFQTGIEWTLCNGCKQDVLLGCIWLLYIEMYFYGLVKWDSILLSERSWSILQIGFLKTLDSGLKHSFHDFPPWLCWFRMNSHCTVNLSWTERHCWIVGVGLFLSYVKKKNLLQFIVTVRTGQVCVTHCYLTYICR